MVSFSAKRIGLVFLFAMSAFAAFVLWSGANPKNKICMGDGVYAEAHTPTFHSLNVVGRVNGKGTLTKYQLSNGVVFGYMSLKNVTLDSLTGLLSDADKEGFFLVDRNSYELTSGMSREALLVLLTSKGEMLDESRWMIPEFQDRLCN